MLTDKEKHSYSIMSIERKRRSLPKGLVRSDLKSMLIHLYKMHPDLITDDMLDFFECVISETVEKVLRKHIDINKFG